MSIFLKSCQIILKMHAQLITRKFLNSHWSVIDWSHHSSEKALESMLCGNTAYDWVFYLVWILIGQLLIDPTTVVKKY